MWLLIERQNPEFLLQSQGIHIAINAEEKQNSKKRKETWREKGMQKN